jgi:hypothetical protein
MKVMLKIKATVYPSDTKTNENTKLTMSELDKFWTQKGCKFNQKLYLALIKAKNQMD